MRFLKIRRIGQPSNHLASYLGITFSHQLAKFLSKTLVIRNENNFFIDFSFQRKQRFSCVTILLMLQVRTKLTQWSEAIKDLKDYLPENDQILLAMLSKIDYMKDLLPVIEFIQEACNDRKTWRQAVQKATKKDEVIDLKTLNELIQYDLTGANLNLLQTT